MVFLIVKEQHIAFLTDNRDVFTSRRNVVCPENGNFNGKFRSRIRIQRNGTNGYDFFLHVILNPEIVVGRVSQDAPLVCELPVGDQGVFHAVDTECVVIPGIGFFFNGSMIRQLGKRQRNVIAVPGFNRFC